MQNLNAIPLSALRVIEAVARTGTLARAAEELGVTPGAVSQRLAKAEAALGQPLFIRNSTGLTPTETCARIAPRVTRAMTELSGAVADMQAAQNTILTVSVAPIFASRWLIWRIRRFNEAHPEISVRLIPTVEVVDMDHSDVDIGIRVGREESVGLGACKLLYQRVFPVCSPEIAATIQKPADLLKHPVIRENDRLVGWDAWLAQHGIAVRELRNGPTYADASLCLDAAMTGQGLFMAWETLACDALERRQVAAPFRQRTETGLSYWFATSRFSERRPCVRKFRTWLEAELECSIRHWETL
ncbi:LysR substrate-binding domain-containing protein [Pseudoruegeria sp. HB172150]|uniref:LysR substrate-binding domain-containing protein n=1 Tax=Pseudoruegeria sp. HB172150 TaxID=2721164 RepID=UPI001554BE98|nr:LysR substrate-binding domain-containing protein [Pseudoruegeria sp. HB172150]